ncbi:hypothetical protein COB64_03245 [Candidatus Wolfebacteria bacterium]|nr:MAG: hypothetical protein COB64_03245 [Candidatus Wolfebacteria bacterium]
MLKRLKIETKLIISFLIVSLLVVVIGYISLNEIKKVQEAFDEVINIHSPPGHAIESMLQLSLIQRRLVDQYTISEKETILRQYNQLKKLLINDREVLERHYVGDEEKNVLINMRKQHTDYNGLIESYFALFNENPNDVKTLDIKKVEIDVVGDKLIEFHDSLFAFKESDIRELKHIADTSVENAQRRILILLLVFLFYSVILGVLIARSISKPIKKLNDATKIIGKGNLFYQINIKNKDEIGELASAFNQMSEDLRERGKEVREQEKKTIENATELSKKISDLEAMRSALLNVTEDTNKKSDRLIKAHKELEEAKRKFEAILASIGDAVVACDKKGNIILFNGVAEELTGFSAKEVIGGHYSDYVRFVEEDTNKPISDLVDKVIKTGIRTKMGSHTMLIHKDGQKIPVADIATPIKEINGDVIGCVIVFRDVIHEWEIDKMKTEFVSVASHQLKTPLTAISWFVEMLNSGEVGELKDKQKEYMTDIYQSNKRMITLVDDLLNVSRLETGTLEIKTTPLQFERIIENTIKDHEALISQKKCHVIFERPTSPLPDILLDESLIRQVVSNLLNNAISYSEEKCTIVIKLEKRSDKYILSVSDNGIGIPKDTQKWIFQKFFRADNAQKIQTEGTGLGLYISKMILENSGGKIWFESPSLVKDTSGKEEKYSTSFYISIPLEGMKQKKRKTTLIAKKI